MKPRKGKPRRRLVNGGCDCDCGGGEDEDPFRKWMNGDNKNCYYYNKRRRENEARKIICLVCGFERRGLALYLFRALGSLKELMYTHVKEINPFSQGYFMSNIYEIFFFFLLR